MASTQITIKYNQYRLDTMLLKNGNQIKEDSKLYKFTQGRMQEWIEKFPQTLVEEYKYKNYEFIFYGTELDYDDFYEVINNAKKENVLDNNCEIKFIEASKGYSDIKNKIIDVYNDFSADNSPFKDDFSAEQVLLAFENMEKMIFPVRIIAAMDTGKTTLINSLLCKKLIPRKNQACTAIITEITDSESDKFHVVAFDNEQKQIGDYSDISLDEMKEINENTNASYVKIEGKIPFLHNSGVKLKLVDTPGLIYSNETQKNVIYNFIKNDNDGLFLFILDVTRLETVGEANLLQFVSKQIKDGDQAIRDKFLFVINKVDLLNEEDDNLDDILKSVKEYLNKFGVKDPLIFPCSAEIPYKIRCGVEDQEDQEDLEYDIRRFNKNEMYHFEKYSSLSDKDNALINEKLILAQKNGDAVQQVLIHSGIISIEQAINNYIEKYFKTKILGDFVLTLRKVINTKMIFEKMKKKFTENQNEILKIENQQRIIKEFLNNSNEIRSFENTIDSLYPLEKIDDLTESKNEDLLKFSEESKVKKVEIEKKYEFLRRNQAEIDQILDINENKSVQDYI